ncbi:MULTISPECIES: hypothetical protein [unclassified Crossiella]|uniref:hypothetical protein n=1 Tax=unclassified Crossiella TaxID=2620835 RepID=UPI001FFEA2C9|nr:MULTISPECIES: hypothetical protein [unclassified Crossiella]MCK2239379.1 hypothetical protein [Crossiella sp. S99.2]MCK2252074.1 hypothetical protein [Crossiella sp. S99.1]
MSQEDMAYSGALPLRLRRWASASTSSTVDGIAAALGELSEARFVVVDHDAEEVLVRALIRRDGIWKQPNVLSAALREAFRISSRVLRTALAEELRRLPGEVTGPGPQLVAAALVAGERTMPPELAAAGRRRGATSRPISEAADATADTVTEPGNPPGKAPAPTHGGPPGCVRPAGGGPDAPGRPAPAETAGQPAGEALQDDQSPDPSGNPSANPLGEGGGGKGEVVPLARVTTPGGGDPRAREGACVREEARELVTEHVPGQPQRVTGRLAAEVARLLAEGIPEQHIGNGLRLWAGKRLGTGLLPELVSEAMREPEISRASLPRSRTDDAVAAGLALAARYAIEDQDDTETGRLLRARVAGGPSSLRELVSTTTVTTPAGESIR